MKPQITIDLEYFERLKKLEKAMTNGDNVSIRLDPYGLFYGEPQYEYTLTFYDPTDSQKKTAEQIQHMKAVLQEKEEEIRSLRSQNDELLFRVNRADSTIEVMEEELEEERNRRITDKLFNFLKIG